MKINLRFLSHFCQLRKIYKIKAFLSPNTMRTMCNYHKSPNCCSSLYSWNGKKRPSTVHTSTLFTMQQLKGYVQCYSIFFLLSTSSMKRPKQTMCSSILSDFIKLSVALRPKATGSYWRCKSLKTADFLQKLLTVVFLFKQTGGNGAFVGDYFQRQMNPHLVLQWVFGAAGRCLWDWVKINYSVCVYGDEGTCHPVIQCGSLMSF